MKLLLEGDRHITDKEPFAQAQRRYTEWLLDQPFNGPDTIYLSEGDFFDSASPTAKEWDIALEFVSRAKFRRMIIQAGNHDYHRKSDTLATSPLVNLPGVEVVTEEKEFLFDSLRVLCLPFFYPNSREGIGTMKEHYEGEVAEAMKGKRFDLLIGHLFDRPVIEGSKDFVDLSGFDAEHIWLGHDHRADLNYVGSPMPTSYTQKGHQGRLYLFDTESKSVEEIEIPRFIDYGEVTYPDALPAVDAEYVIWTVTESLDKQTTLDFYSESGKKPFYTRRIEKKREEKEQKLAEKSEHRSIEEMFNDFCAEKGKPDRVKEIVLPLLAGTDSAIPA